MGKKMSGATRAELVKAIGERYGAGSRVDKLRILDEFVAVTGYHRKHAIRVLNGREAKRQQRRSRTRLYDEAVRNVLDVRQMAVVFASGTVRLPVSR